MNRSIPARRLFCINFAALTAVAGLTCRAVGQSSQSLIFDNISNVSSADGGGALDPTFGTASEYMGAILTLPGGISSLTGVDVVGYNYTTTAYDAMKVNVFVWGAVNSDFNDGYSATSPAYADLLGEFTFTSKTSYAAGSVVYIAGSGSSPTLAFPSAVPLPQTSSGSLYGITLNFQGSTNNGLTYTSAPGLGSYFLDDVAPAVGSVGFNGINLSANGETNGNFTSGPYTFYDPTYDPNPTDQTLALRVFGVGVAASDWTTNFGGDWNTTTNWKSNAVPTSTTDAIFNLSSISAYTVTVSQANTAADLYVQNDNVILDLNTAASSLTVTGALSVAPTATGGFGISTLSLTHSFGGPAANVSAASCVVGGSGGSGILTVGSGVNLVVSGTTSIAILSTLTVSPGGRLYTNILSIAGSTGAWTGKLDLGTSQLDLPGNRLATITSQVTQGYANGSWEGIGGIVSSAAAADTAHLTGIGVISNNVSGSALYGSIAPRGLFGGLSPGLNDVLVKYTYYGDTDLSGTVDGSDYSRIDATYLAENFSNGVATNPISGWFNGDFNYDGVVDGSDYTLMDNAFNQQGGGAVSPDAMIDIGQRTASFTTRVFDGTETGTLKAAQYTEAEGAVPTTLLAGSPIPEPTGLGVLCLATIGMLHRRRRFA